MRRYGIDRQADVVIWVDGRPHVFEVQRSDLDIVTMSRRAEDYVSKGIYLCWVLMLRGEPQTQPYQYRAKAFERWVQGFNFHQVRKGEQTQFEIAFFDPQTSLFYLGTFGKQHHTIGSDHDLMFGGLVKRFGQRVRQPAWQDFISGQHLRLRGPFSLYDLRIMRFHRKFYKRYDHLGFDWPRGVGMTLAERKNAS